MDFLPTDWKSFIWGVAVAGLGIFLAAVLKKFGEDAYAIIKSKWFGPKPSGGVIDVPSKTMVLIPVSHQNALWWHMGSAGDQPLMQIVGRFNVTNISKHSIFVMAAKLRKPKAVGYAHVRAQKSNTFSDRHSIPPGGISELSFQFYVQPPVREAGKLFKADVAIVDQFANEHWLKGLEFPYN